MQNDAIETEAEMRFLLHHSNIDSEGVIAIYTECDFIYMEHKDPEYWIYLTAMVST